MRTVNVETSLGVIPVTGHFGGRRAVLAITGAFADPSEMSRHPETVAAEFDGYVAHLPGNQTPHLSETSVAAFARAFDEVLATLGPTVVVGVSAGALVALGMRSPLLRAVVAVEPPLATAKLWPITEEFRRALGTRHDAFIRNVFGIHEDRVEERAYSKLLDGLTVPLTTILGDEPLMPQRPVQRLPSLVDEPERELLKQRGWVSIARGAGHGIPRQAGGGMVGVVLRVSRLSNAEEPERARV